MNLSETVAKVVKVLHSCKTKEQYDGSFSWGINAISKAATETPKKYKPQNRGKKLERITSPRITCCKLCDGTGKIDGGNCLQCEGSGRVIVTSEVVTYINAYKPKE